MNAISYKQLRAFAAQYGAVVGLMWIVSFAFYIIGLTRPLVGNVGLIIGLLSVVTAGFLIRKFRGEVFPLRFGQSWWMATLIFHVCLLAHGSCPVCLFPLHRQRIAPPNLFHHHATARSCSHDAKHDAGRGRGRSQPPSHRPT